MLHCDSCKIDVTGAPESCPLCQGPLSGQPDPRGGLYVPLDRQRKRESLVFAIITMSALAVIVVSMAVDYIIDPVFRWSLPVAAGAVCAWCFAMIGWRKRAELAKNIFIQTMLVSAVGILWDLALGWQGWSIDFVIPGVCIAAVLALSVLALVLQMDSSEYMPYLWTVSLYGLAPLVFMLAGAVRVRFPSVVCIALSLLTVAALLLFFRRSALEEIKKKLHM